MDVRPEPIPRPDWSPVPREGCINVEGKVLRRADDVSLALLRFAPHGTIDEHPASIAIDVICLEGGGFTSIAGVAVPLRAGEAIRWPAGQPHRLWTESEGMLTLMVEHTGGMGRMADAGRR
ncbi:MAG: cupin domain-containing protein [Dehalococcoidia bacterium]